MKICKRLLCSSLALFTCLLVSPTAGQQIGDGVFDPGGVQPYFADVNFGWPGRVWVEASLADRGLGYQGSYFTVGAKTHCFQDFLDGRWLVEGQGHVSAINGGFFANIGLERVFSLEAAQAEITTSFWYDYDSDLQGNFGHAMNQLGISAGIKKRQIEVLGNAYFPVGTSDYLQGDPTGVNCFLNHSIVIQAGIDSALKGFDAIVRFKPNALAQVNGSFGLGGYNYGSNVVDYFGGLKATYGMQLEQGMIVNLELNHDNRFDVTGVLQLGWMFGVNARGNEYGLLGTDLEPTWRNDHIVRYQQDLVLAIDPDTGRPYNVYHVDNLADPTIENGTFETPFDNLADAEAASSTDDIIFVNPGDGTVRNMDAGITLKDGQMLLGNGVQHLIPLPDGTLFDLCNSLDGNLPRITNRFGGNAVTLANRNTVRGFLIDGATGNMLNGIAGVGTAGNRLNDGLIEDVTIFNGATLHGIRLDQISGNWRIARSNVLDAASDGIAIQNAGDASSFFDIENNVVINNGRHGIRLADYDGFYIRFRENDTSFNAADGIRVRNFANSTGLGAALDFISSQSQTNAADGIRVDNFVGNVRFLNSLILNNTNNGISLLDVRTPGISQRVFVGSSGPATSVIDGNGVGTGSGIFNELGVAGTQQLLVVDTSLDNGGTGITSGATAVGANLQTDLVYTSLGLPGEPSISGNQSDGIRLLVENGASHSATVLGVGTAATPIIGNNGSGISLYAAGGGSPSLLQVDIDNLNVSNSGVHGMLINAIENAQIISRARDMTIDGAGLDGVRINADNNSSLAVNEFSFETVNISNVGVNGIQMTVGTDTFADFSLTNSTLSNPNTGSSGITINVTGDNPIGPHLIDTRFRAWIVGNTINGFDTGTGLELASFGDAHVLAQIDGNTITGNGLNQVATGTPAAPFSPGMLVQASGESMISTRILNNNISQNAAQGLRLETNDDGRVNALVVNNVVTGNSNQTVQFFTDMNATNSITGDICLAMSTNLFGNQAVLDNPSAAAATFRVELDGLTNGLNVPTFLPNLAAFTVTGFNGVCATAIDNEESAFDSNGFLPWP